MEFFNQLRHLNKKTYKLIVLGRGAEESLRQSVLLSASGFFVFLERPVALIFILIGLIVFFWRGMSQIKQKDTEIINMN